MGLKLTIALSWMLLAAALCGAQEPVVITLDHPIRRVEGVVQNAHGEGVPNLDVEVFTAANHDIVASTRTDSKGRFSTEKVAPGAYEVSIRYKPHPVFRDVIYKVMVDAKGSKEPLLVKLQELK